MTQIPRALPALALVAFSGSACYERTGETGELGNIYYSLYTDYQVSEQYTLTDFAILTGYTQRFDVDLTRSGWDLVDDLSELQHSISPEQDALLQTHEFDADDPYEEPGFDVLVTGPGTYTVESRAGGDLIDRIDLAFDKPDALQAVGWVLAPYSEDWEQMDPQPVVEEGTAAALLSVPVDAGGRRLLGDIEFVFEAEPETSVVPIGNVYEVTETSIAYSTTPVQVVFIEPGTVTIWLKDEVNAVESAYEFEVVAAQG